MPDTKSMKSAIKKIRPPAIIKNEPLVRYRRRPPEKEIMPQTLHGEGTGDYEKSPADSKNSLSPSKGKNASRKGENKSSLTPSKEQGLAQPDKDGSALAPHSYLFDKKTIEKFASEGSSPKKGLTFDTSEFKHRGYMRMLKERIEDIWKYPAEAARQGISGDLYMKFSIKKDGRIADIELLRTSGHKELDEAAMKAVKNAEPFWPLPEDWDKDILEIKGHFIYVFGNTLVM
ncbi:MAG: energy transducer TonB [Nitrospirae bacterium]|nr:energy transducer TonB [Nitrospirota bacterium]